MMGARRPSMSRRRLKHLASTLVVPLFFVMGFQAAAWADSSSGWVNEDPYTVQEHSGQVNWCSEAVITSSAQNRSYEYTVTYNNTCGGSSTWGAPSGYMDVEAEAFNQGGQCSYVAGPSTNSSTTYTFGVGGDDCSGAPCALENTITYNYLWQYSSDSYVGGDNKVSPWLYVCP